MTTRITEKQLYNHVNHLNSLLGFDDVKYNTPNSYQLDAAYGGWKLVKIHPDGGQLDVTTGFMPKKFVYNYISGLISGLSINMKK